MVGKISEISFTGNLGYMRFHDLRHTCATRAIERSISSKVLHLLLGHTSIQATMERYVQVTSKSLVEAIQLFEQNPGNIDIPTLFWSTTEYKSMSLLSYSGSKLFSYSGMC